MQIKKNHLIETHFYYIVDFKEFYLSQHQITILIVNSFYDFSFICY